MNMGSHQQDPERSRRTFYRISRDGGKEKFWYLDPKLANAPVDVGTSTLTNFNLLNRVKLVEKEEDANMWVGFWDELAMMDPHPKDVVLREFLQGYLDKWDFEEEQRILVGVFDVRVRAPSLRTSASDTPAKKRPRREVDRLGS